MSSPRFYKGIVVTSLIHATLRLDETGIDVHNLWRFACYFLYRCPRPALGARAGNSLSGFSTSTHTFEGGLSDNPVLELLGLWIYKTLVIDFSSLAILESGHEQRQRIKGVTMVLCGPASVIRTSLRYVSIPE